MVTLASTFLGILLFFVSAVLLFITSLGKGIWIPMVVSVGVLGITFIVMQLHGWVRARQEFKKFTRLFLWDKD